MVEVVRRKADWDDIRVFWAVASLGSFAAAARALDSAVTTITRTVDRLEERLNTKLLERGPHGATLTDAGEKVYDFASTMERSAEALENTVLNSESALEGRVKIAARDGLAGLILSTRLPSFLDSNPLIDVVLDTEQTASNKWAMALIAGVASLGAAAIASTASAKTHDGYWDGGGYGHRGDKHYEYRCTKGRDDHCAWFRCDRDGDDCRQISRWTEHSREDGRDWYGNGRRVQCDDDGDDCRVIHDWKSRYGDYGWPNGW